MTQLIEKKQSGPFLVDTIFCHFAPRNFAVR